MVEVLPPFMRYRVTKRHTNKETYKQPALDLKLSRHYDVLSII